MIKPIVPGSRFLFFYSKIGDFFTEAEMLGDMTSAQSVKVRTRVGRNEIRSVLEDIQRIPSIHAKWLNTLSLLEHIGARKIHASQTGISISEMVLRHASEEARHAAFFKKLALKVGSEEFSSYEEASLLAGNSAVMYFQRLDSLVNRSLSSETFALGKRKLLCYLYVTKLIEERAGLVYEEYEQALSSSESGISLKSIIKEEEAHLQEMNFHLQDSDPKFSERTDYFREKESMFFSKFFGTLRNLVPKNS
ncbi:hypothetical protein LEP1GSC047_3901 [Leptospira inadai serovar Lyme str. 10]|uniref:Rubrerythrin n=3 Tax=Leptospira inadai TaxID=29506 RepID=V6HCE6_9LEPT|nr:hypothetical protein LEP1GSC047_3901 [Leptospira inadai serovar Lyme str. 10]PNV76344.1 hypothetical protein BES34_004925 [Leptospira inadai serovar Lyme]